MASAEFRQSTPFTKNPIKAHNLECSNSASDSVCACPAAGPGSVPSRAERLVEIYFSPFNSADCVSLMARLTTYMGCQVGQVANLLGLATVVQPL